MSADEKTFAALGQDWTARFDFNSICEIEERYDRPFLDMVGPMLSGVGMADKDDPAKVAAAAARIKFSDLRAILHQALLARHADVTLPVAGEIIGEIGLEGVMEIVGWAVVKAMPAGKGGEGAAKGNPRKR